MKKTVVIGASPNPTRFSHKMVRSLQNHGFEVVPVGFRNGKIGKVEILKGQPDIEDVHTVSLYLGPRNQPPFYDYVLALRPKRIIFNPGTYNPEFLEIANKQGIEAVIDCGLVMLAKRDY